jgi:diguanylate cyclase (GGDEF)-like protein
MHTGARNAARTAELSVDPAVRYAGAAAAVLAPVCAAVAALYVVLAVTHPMVLGGSAGTTMSVVAGLSAIGLGILALIGYLRPPRLRYANALLAVVVLVVILNSSLHMIITGDTLQTTNLMLAVIAAGVAILRTGWNIAVTAVAWVAWFIGMQLSDGVGLVHWLFAMAMATLVAQLARYGRRSSLDTAAESVSRVAELSVQDPLTGLANRRGLEVLGEEMLAIAVGSGNGLSVAFFDVDGLKEVNDRHGHDAGDEVLLAVSHALRATCRTTDVIARWGGDEFVVLTIGHDLQADLVESEVVAALAAAAEVSDDVWHPSVSVGVAAVGAPSDRSLDELLTEADEAMYQRRRQQRLPQE